MLEEILAKSIFQPLVVKSAIESTSTIFELLGFLIAFAEIRFPERTDKAIKFFSREVLLSMRFGSQLPLKKALPLYLSLGAFALLITRLGLDQLALVFLMINLFLIVPAGITLAARHKEHATATFGISLGLTALAIGETAEFVFSV